MPTKIIRKRDNLKKYFFLNGIFWEDLGKDYKIEFPYNRDEFYFFDKIYDSKEKDFKKILVSDDGDNWIKKISLKASKKDLNTYENILKTNSIEFERKEKIFKFFFKKNLRNINQIFFFMKLGKIIGKFEEFEDGGLVELIPNRLKVSFEEINQICPLKNVDEKFRRYLKDMDFEFSEKKNEFEISIPNLKRFIYSQQDLIAEFYNYEFDSRVIEKVSKKPNLNMDESLVKSLMSENFREIQTYSLENSEFLKRFIGKENFFRIKNPISKERDCLRSIIYPSHLKIIISNLKEFPYQRNFEIDYIQSKENFSKKICMTILDSNFSLNYLKNLGFGIIKKYLGNYFEEKISLEEFYVWEDETKKKKLGFRGVIEFQKNKIKYFEINLSGNG